MGTIISCSDWTDIAQAETELAALRHAPPDTRFISVDVEPFSAINAAFCVRLMAESLPEGSVILSSADPRAPGVPREPLAIHFEPRNLHLVCPNIGIPTMLLERFEPVRAVRMSFEAWETSVFNGRDIYAPTAGRIMAGRPLEELGDPFPVNAIHRLDIARGTVLHIDNYGNVKLYTYDDLGDRDHVVVDGRRIPVVVNHKTRSGETIPEGALVATSGSSFGLVELHVKASREHVIGAATVLGLKIGDRVELEIDAEASQGV